MDKPGRVGWRRFEKFLFAVGCEFKGQDGSHRKYHKSGIARPIIVPAVDELAPFIISNNLRTLGVSKEEYLSIIAKL